MLKICISGGPCSGKSSAQSILTQILNDRGYKTLFCPETATELIINGIVPGEKISLEEFQNFVLKKQLSKEKLYDEMAEYFDKDKLVIIYDRGLCDQMAYIEKNKFEKMLLKQGLSISDAYAHYDAVMHLVTAADGAAEYYQWNDPSKEDNGNNAARSESPEEAIIKDKKTLNSWIGHPHLRVFDNSTNFEGKINRVIKEVFMLLGEPLPKEIERKFLIKMPTKEQLDKLGCLSESKIIQTYLTSNNPDIERRVRQTGNKSDGFSFYYTEKKDLDIGERVEKEKRISPEEYISYLVEADTSLHQILKTRRCFIFNKKYYEMDIFSFNSEYAILEIELNDISEEIELPPLEIIKEVTDDKDFKNYNIAKTMKLNLEHEHKNVSDWTYETGREEPEILGSGSQYYNVVITKNKEKALKEYKEAGRNYLKRYRIVNNKKEHQLYDCLSKTWLSD